MEALFIGQAYIDVTFLTDRMPIGDQKHVASSYAVSFGGNAVTAAFCAAKLGRMFKDMAATYAIPLHPRRVRTSSLSFIMPKDGKRAIVRCRDADYLEPFPLIDLTGCRVVHVDGHQPDAAIHYVERARNEGILTSLDGGGLRPNTHELLAFIDIAIVSERLCEQMGLDQAGMLDYLKSRGCRIGGVTCGERGMVWYDETGTIQILPALAVPSARVIDTSGAGDVFHGAYVYSYLTDPAKPWREHFRFGRAAAAYKVQHLGNEAGLPSLSDIVAVQREFGAGDRNASV